MDHRCTLGCDAPVGARVGPRPRPTYHERIVDIPLA